MQKFKLFYGKTQEIEQSLNDWLEETGAIVQSISLSTDFEYFYGHFLVLYTMPVKTVYSIV